MHVLFVCTGNICRSPIAERLAMTLAKDRKLTEFQASSAGTRAVIGHPIHQNAVKVLRSFDVESVDFAARQLTPAVISTADLILTMTRAHRDNVLEAAPHRLRQTFTIYEASRLITEFGASNRKELASLRGHLAGSEHIDVLDPIGQDMDTFNSVGMQIADLIGAILHIND